MTLTNITNYHALRKKAVKLAQLYMCIWWEISRKWTMTCGGMQYCYSIPTIQLFHEILDTSYIDNMAIDQKSSYTKV